MTVVKKLIELVGIAPRTKFIMKCPNTGMMHVMRKHTSSVSQNHYMSTQGFIRGRLALLKVATPMGQKHHLTRSDLCTEDAKYRLF